MERKLKKWSSQVTKELKKPLTASIKGVVSKLKENLNESDQRPVTFIQLGENIRGFFSKTIDILREASVICYDKLKEIPCITCLHKTEGSMFAMVKLNLLLLEDMKDDLEFCVKLAKEESVIILPGVVGMKNWLRITFGIEPSALEVGLGRVKAFVKGMPRGSEDYIRTWSTSSSRGSTYHIDPVQASLQLICILVKE